jgi:hypothetical protein
MTRARSHLGVRSAHLHRNNQGICYTHISVTTAGDDNTGKVACEATNISPALKATAFQTPRPPRMPPTVFLPWQVRVLDKMIENSTGPPRDALTFHMCRLNRLNSITGGPLPQTSPGCTHAEQFLRNVLFNVLTLGSAGVIRRSSAHMVGEGYMGANTLSYTA